MTDRTDFETALERRMRAYAATAVRHVPAREIASSTMWAAATPVGRTSAITGPRRPALLVALVAILLLAAVAGAAFVGGLPPAIHGVFVDGPSFAPNRIVNAVALADGRVLVGVVPEEGTIPGTTTFVRRCSAPCLPHLSLLDPRTRSFTPTRELPPSLAFASMALLRDGRVLIVRSSAGGGDDPSAIIYDPTADRFHETGAPLVGRDWPFLVTLADGRVLVGGGSWPAETGGSLAAETALATAELFDPATGTFSPAGSMTRPRTMGVSATLLPDGRVLVVGGGADVGTSAELFDPATGMFTPTGPMTVGRGGFHSATLLADGRVLLAGGFVPFPADPNSVPDPTATAEVYDPATATFSAVGPMAAPRYGHAASLLADGTVLIAGGGHDIQPESAPVAASDAEIFDPATGAFRATGSLHRPRLMPAIVSTDDRVLVLGHQGPFDDHPAAASSSEWFE